MKTISVRKLGIMFVADGEFTPILVFFFLKKSTSILQAFIKWYFHIEILCHGLMNTAIA